MDKPYPGRLAHGFHHTSNAVFFGIGNVWLQVFRLFCHSIIIIAKKIPS